MHVQRVEGDAPIIDTMSRKHPIEHQQSDPFGEHERTAFSRTVHVLGGRFEFQGNCRELLDLVDAAYAGLPQQLLSPDAPPFQIRLQLTGDEGIGDRSDPPDARMHGGAGFFGAMMDADNFAIVFPEQRRGLVALSSGLLRRFPYHARYELLEFAVFTLASRAQQLVPLHAGCVAIGGSGALLVGETGAGKSTLALQCMLQGCDFVTEDAAFVDASSLRVVGVANFLHLRADALPWIGDEAVAARVRQSPVIRRRSGVEKFELDLRRSGGVLASAPLVLGSMVFISKEAAAPSNQALTRIDPTQMAARLAASQPYAAHLPSWDLFAKRLAHLEGYELKRGLHPRDAAGALRELIGKASSASTG